MSKKPPIKPPNRPPLVTPPPKETIPPSSKQAPSKAPPAQPPAKLASPQPAKVAAPQATKPASPLPTKPTAAAPTAKPAAQAVKPAAVVAKPAPAPSAKPTHKQGPPPSAAGAWTIIGVDCATQDERIGLARGTLDANGKLRVERVTLGTAGESAAASICQWIAGKPRYVIALDAPLGWPAALRKALASHRAGAELTPSADELFHRYTDHVVHRELGKLPLAVGADRIARTARAALGLLGAVGQLRGVPVALAWEQAEESGAIEVSPTATLSSRSLHKVGYKADTSPGRNIRHDILKRLSAEISIDVTHDVMIEDADLLDALLCVLAGADFARGHCVEPDKIALAKKEGFIWFRDTGQHTLAFGKRTP